MKAGAYSPFPFLIAAGVVLGLIALPWMVRFGINRTALAFGIGCLILLLLASLPRLASWRRGRGRPTLSTADVEALLLGSGALVVDLRDETVFRTGHIRGCMHVPYAELPARFKVPDPKATRDLILVDESDRLSHEAYEVLARRGFTGVHILQGGMKAWRAASLPLSR